MRDFQTLRKKGEVDNIYSFRCFSQIWMLLIVSIFDDSQQIPFGSLTDFSDQNIGI
jgi:hypothetical protein